MRNSFSSVLLGAVLAFSSTASWAETWTLEKYPADGFQAEFPGSIRIAPVELSERQRNFMEHITEYVTTFRAVDFRVSVAHGLPNATVNIEGAATGNLVNAQKCQTIDKRSIGDAIEWVGTNCKTGLYRHRLRLFVKDKWLYQVSVVSPLANDQAAEKHFVESFKLIGN